MSFDLYPMATLANRRRLLPELAEQGTLVVFPHDSELPWAKLSKSKSGITAERVE